MLLCYCQLVLIISSMTITRAPQSWTSAGMEASGCLARARMLLTARLAIPSLASTVALPMCGKMTRLGQVSRGLEGGRGSGVQTSSPAPAQLCLLRRLERGGRGGGRGKGGRTYLLCRQC